MPIPPKLLLLAARTLRSEGDQLPSQLPEAMKKLEPGQVTAPGGPPPEGYLTRLMDAPVDHLTSLQLLPLQETLSSSMVLLRLPQRTHWRTSLSTRVQVGKRI